MEEWRRRIALAIVAVVTIVFTYALVYQQAMATFEDEEISFVHALRVVVEALTMAGYGGDTDLWTSPEMNALVVGMTVSGLALVFVGLPLFALPMLKEAFQDRPPRTSTLTDHVIICGHNARDDVLSAELEAVDIPYLYVDSDAEEVMDLREDGISAIHGDTERVDTFHAANASEAVAVVADVADDLNPTIMLSARRANPDLTLLSVVRDTAVTTYHEYAGADEVVEGPQVLGESLGMRAVTSFAEKFRAALDVDSDLAVTELLVEEDSRLVGTTLGEATVFDEMGATVIGGWFDGKFVVSPGPETIVEENTILLVAGHYEDFSAVTARPLPAHRDDPERVVVCGHGVVGRAVGETLDEEGIDYDVVDIRDHDGTDVVGDVTDPETLRRAAVDDARAVVLALDRDATTVFAALVLNELAPDVEVIARVHDPDNVWKLYNAGADFALSMSVVTGELLASHLIKDRTILTPKAEFEFERTEAPALVGRSLSEVDIRAQTGCTVVAVERDGELLTDPGPDFVVEDGDVLVVLGTERETEDFLAFATEQATPGE